MHVITAQVLRDTLEEIETRIEELSSERDSFQEWIDSIAVEIEVLLAKKDSIESDLTKEEVE